MTKLQISSSFCCIIIMFVGSSTAQTVDADCMAQDANLARLTYKGDARGVVGFQANNSVCMFIEDIPTACFFLNVEYTDSGQGACVMTKADGSNTFSMKIQARLLAKAWWNEGDLDFEVVCNFEPSSDPVEFGISIKQEASIPQVVQHEKGTPALSDFSLSVRKIDGAAFTGPVTLGRIVKLVAIMDPKASSEVGLKPSMCTAEASDGSNSNVIISNGCGTGTPFPLGYGFTTKNFVSESPTFRMFAVQKGLGVRFNCSFIACTDGSCEGSSCDEVGTNVRRRRHVGHVQNVEHNPVVASTILHNEGEGVIMKPEPIPASKLPRVMKARTKPFKIVSREFVPLSADVEVKTGVAGELLLPDMDSEDVEMSELAQQRMESATDLKETALLNEITALAVVVVVLSIVILVLVCLGVFMLTRKKEFK